MSVSDSLDLVPVLEAGLPLGVAGMEALGLQSLLAAEGIAAVVSGYWAEPVLPFRVLVSSADLARACRLVEESRAAGSAAADEAELAGEAAGDRPPDDLEPDAKGVF